MLADSPIVAFTRDGPSLLADSRLAYACRAAPRYRDRLAAGGGYGSDHVVALRASAGRGRAAAQPGGRLLGRGGRPGRGALREARAPWRRDESLSAVLMASDGVSCGVDTTACSPDWSAVRDAAPRSGADAVLDAVRAAERSDPDGSRWPRAKPHDDQALVLVDFA